MKLTQISPHIWSLRLWFGIPIHVWLVRDSEGLTLVDAGIPPMARGILRTIDRLGVGPLRQIVLTHGHSDHVGALPGILRSRPVPVYAHPIEIPYLEGQVAYPRRKKATPSVRPGLVAPLPRNDAGQPRNLAGLTPHLTPGHSPGHVVYHHEHDDVLLAGDLATSRRGRLRPPMAIFTGDMDQAMVSLEIVRTLKPGRIEVCHGGPVLMAGLEKHPAEHLPAGLTRGAGTSV